MEDPIRLHHPTKKDTKSIHRLIKNSKPLDLNSEYLYLLQSTYFSDTCIVAKKNDHVVGFVSGFISPKDKEIFFVWQVAVDSTIRGHGIAIKMLTKLFNSPELAHIKYIHTTISPSNVASQKVFEKFADDFGFDKEISVFATKEDFEEAHEDELLYILKPKTTQGVHNEGI